MHSGEKPAKYAAVCCWRLSVTRSVCVCVCVLQTAAPAILVSVLPRDQKGDSQLDWGGGGGPGVRSSSVGGIRSALLSHLAK